MIQAAGSVIQDAGKDADSMKLLFSPTANAVDLPHPKRQTDLAAGLDLYANVETDVLLHPGERILIPTGIRIALPFGMEGQVRPRSGLALNFGVTVLNAPGTVDADYRGELKVLLINHGNEIFTIHRGDRIAQLVVAQVAMWEAEKTDNLPETQRGEGGYGSTGVGI